MKKCIIYNSNVNIFPKNEASVSTCSRYTCRYFTKLAQELCEHHLLENALACREFIGPVMLSFVSKLNFILPVFKFLNSSIIYLKKYGNVMLKMC